MKTVYEILEEIKSDGSTKFKQKVLEDNKDDSVLKMAVQLAYDPDIQYGLKKIPPYIPNPFKKYMVEESYTNEVLYHSMTKLSILTDRKKTGNEAIEFLRGMLASLTVEDASVIEKIIKRDLDCGFGKTISRKVWPDLFQKHHVMLCQPYNDKNMDRINYPAMLQLKVDGMRMSVIIEDGVVTWKTRNGKVVDMQGVHDNDFLNIARNISLSDANFADCVIDGELLMVNDDGSYQDRKTGNGNLNRIIKGKGTIELIKQVRMVSWDAIPLEDFIGGVSEYDTETRYDLLKHALPEQTIVSMTTNEIVNSRSQANQVFVNYLANGQEGAIIKNIAANWKDGRSNDFVKMKNEDTMDLKVIGWNEHKKKPTLLGSLECSNSDGSIIVNVGSGFTAEDRKTIGKDIIGEIIEVKYNEIITKRGSDIRSLFLPIYLSTRIDKNEID